MRQVGSFQNTNPGSLRLVGAGESAAGRPAPRADRPHSRRAAVAAENHAAAGLDLEDARLVFAVRVAERLDAGRAAILTPDTRQSLMRLSSRMGMEPFDASLVIAIVLDAARRGEPTNAPMTTSRLKLVKPAQRRADNLLLPLATALVLAAVLLTALTSWITK